jgi:hypothetical protein
MRQTWVKWFWPLSPKQKWLGCLAETRHLLNLHIIRNSRHQAFIHPQPVLPNGRHRASIFPSVMPDRFHRASIFAVQNLSPKNPERTATHSEQAGRWEKAWECVMNASPYPKHDGCRVSLITEDRFEVVCEV